jgi:mannitol/fructose-specific phosphotransferase system IIA component (Ntr-type)
MLHCFYGGTVVARLASRDKFEAIRELIREAPVFDGTAVRDKIAEAVIAREKLLSTGLGRGVAVAHGTTDAVSEIIIALGISSAGIDYGAADEEPVHLLFVITNPPEKQAEYLLALAAVARLVRDDAFRQSLRREAPSHEIETRICDAFSESLKNYLTASA